MCLLLYLYEGAVLRLVTIACRFLQWRGCRYGLRRSATALGSLVELELTATRQS